MILYTVDVTAATAATATAKQSILQDDELVSIFFNVARTTRV